MPNGISCSFFAYKNYLIGKRDHNIFRTGIAGAQTIRSVNCAAKAAPVIDNSSKFAKACSKVASIAKKILYPLIILSGVYTTAKSDDKVKTGITQGSSILTMFTSEQISERLLKKLDTKVKSSAAIKENKYLRYGYYILKGAAYAASSLFGYDLGNKISSNIVDKVRAKSAQNGEIKFGEVDDTKAEDVFDEIENELPLEQNSQNHKQDTTNL